MQDSNSCDGIIITDIKGVIQWVTPAFHKLTGYSSEESIGTSLKFLNSGVHNKEFFKTMWNQIKNFVAIKQDISERKRLEEISRTEKKRMETELDVARDIQMSMLKKNSQVLKNQNDVDVFAKIIPAREVGGDFYDYFWLDEERLCFFIGDVSGKG
ncbi:MAG: PAS domain S-box protein, partial [Bacteroidetes bacterium]|nr:PAS domain S-box protein [Bacteroidota bacterium]